MTRQPGFELEGTNVPATAIYPGVVDTAMSAHLSGQEPEIVGAVSQALRTAYAEGKLLAPDIPRRFIIAIVFTEDSSLNGPLIDIRNEQGQKLAQTSVTSL